MSDKTTTVTVSENGQGLFTQTVEAGKHLLAADEPAGMGGLDSAPAPYDFLLASLGACTTMTLRMYARQKNWEPGKISVRLTHVKETDAEGKKRDVITRDISMDGNLDQAQRARMLEIANKCPVHRTLENKPQIVSTLSPRE